MKFVPVTVKLKSAPPAVVELGVMLVKVGAGFVCVILKLSPFEAPPPGVGLKTVTCDWPVPIRSLERICAVNWVALTNVVVRGAPSQRTAAPLTKPVPVTVNVKAPLPSSAEFGLRLVNTGTGFGALMVNVCAAEVPPPGVGLKTVICAVPALTMSAAGICAVNCVVLTKVVVRAVPFQRITEAGTKPVPVAVNVKVPEPCNAEAGLMLVNTGAGFWPAIVIWPVLLQTTEDWLNWRRRELFVSAKITSPVGAATMPTPKGVSMRGLAIVLIVKLEGARFICAPAAAPPSPLKPLVVPASVVTDPSAATRIMRWALAPGALLAVSLLTT